MFFYLRLKKSPEANNYHLACSMLTFYSEQDFEKLVSYRLENLEIVISSSLKIQIARAFNMPGGYWALSIDSSKTVNRVRHDDLFGNLNFVFS